MYKLVNIDKVNVVQPPENFKFIFIDTSIKNLMTRNPALEIDEKAAEYEKYYYGTLKKKFKGSVIKKF